jgi:hypothetical protein
VELSDRPHGTATVIHDVHHRDRTGRQMDMQISSSSLSVPAVVAAVASQKVTLYEITTRNVKLTAVLV